MQQIGNLPRRACVATDPAAMGADTAAPPPHAHPAGVRRQPGRRRSLSRILELARVRHTCCGRTSGSQGLEQDPVALRTRYSNPRLIVFLLPNTQL